MGYRLLCIIHIPMYSYLNSPATRGQCNAAPLAQVQLSCKRPLKRCNAEALISSSLTKQSQLQRIYRKDRPIHTLHTLHTLHTYIHTHIHTHIHYITLHCITLHYSTLHYITYIHTYIHTYSGKIPDW